MTQASEASQIAVMVEDAFESCRGRASKETVFQLVIDALWSDSLVSGQNRELIEYAARQGLRTQINRFFSRKRADGLPQAPLANDSGEHVRLSLFSVDEFEFAARKQLDRSVAARSQALRYVDECLAVHGVALDLDAEAVAS